MSRGQHTFRLSDLQKALKAAANAGMTVQRYEIDKSGKIVVVTARSEQAEDGNKPEGNEWDEVLP